MRSFETGDLVICTVSGVIGKVLKFYVPTASEEQTMVQTLDGRKYHAPTRLWKKILDFGKVNYIWKNIQEQYLKEI